MKKRPLRTLLAALLLTSACLALCACGDGEARVPAGTEARVPILLYHHLTAEEGSDPSTCIAPARFGEHLDALAQAGYTSVSLSELSAFVREGAPLPEKCICITFDDGYYSNYEYAWPALRERGMKAAIFTIGVSVGHKDFYKQTDHPLTPHFGWEEAGEMIASGVIEVESHTWDLHQYGPYEVTAPVRSNALPLEGESEESYRAAMAADYAAMDDAFREHLGRGVTTVSYPGGMHSALSEEVLRGLGAGMTVTTEWRCSTLVCGEEDTLYGLGRMNVSGTMTGEELLNMLDTYCKSEGEN